MHRPYVHPTQAFIMLGALSTFMQSLQSLPGPPQLYQKSIWESEKPSKTSLLSSPAVDTKVLRTHQCFRLAAGTDASITDGFHLFRGVYADRCNDRSGPDLWGDRSAGGRTGQWRICDFWVYLKGFLLKKKKCPRVPERFLLTVSFYILPLKQSVNPPSC